MLEALLHEGALSQRELGRKVLTPALRQHDGPGGQAGDAWAGPADPAEPDRRAVQVDLTAAGRALIEPLFARHATDIAVAMGGLNGVEMAQLSMLLRKLGRAAGFAEE